MESKEAIMTDKITELEAKLTKQFKGQYLDEKKFNNAIRKETSKRVMPSGYRAKSIIDPYSKRIIKVKLVKII